MPATPVADLDAALRLPGVVRESTFDIPPQWCAWCSLPRPVAVGVTWTNDGECLHADACRTCAPELIRSAHAVSPEGHAVLVAVIFSDE